MVPLKLALISNDRETLDGVTLYFERAGARVRSTTRLEEIGETTSSADAIIFFADDYPSAEAECAVSTFSARLTVVVTAEVAAFNACCARRTQIGRVVVLPRPAWGWVLLEAIRSGDARLEH
jgi:hypothetical protein